MLESKFTITLSKLRKYKHVFLLYFLYGQLWGSYPWIFYWTSLTKCCSRTRIWRSWRKIFSENAWIFLKNSLRMRRTARSATSSSARIWSWVSTRPPRTGRNCMNSSATTHLHQDMSSARCGTIVVAWKRIRNTSTTSLVRVNYLKCNEVNL